MRGGEGGGRKESAPSCSLELLLEAKIHSHDGKVPDVELHPVHKEKRESRAITS